MLRKDSGARKKCNNICGKRVWALEFCTWLYVSAAYQLWHLRQNTSSFCVSGFSLKKKRKKKDNVAHCRSLTKHELLFLRTSLFPRSSGGCVCNSPKCKPSTGNLKTRKWMLKKKNPTNLSGWLRPQFLLMHSPQDGNETQHFTKWPWQLSAMTLGDEISIQATLPSDLKCPRPPTFLWPLSPWNDTWNNDICN